MIPSHLARQEGERRKLSDVQINVVLWETSCLLCYTVTFKISNNTRWVQIPHQFCMWSIKLTYGYNLWLIVSLKWIIQKKGFVSFREIFCFYSILLWLILLFEETWSQFDQEYEYTRSSLKTVKRQHLGGFSLAKIAPTILSLPMSCTKNIYVIAVADRFPERPYSVVHNCKRVKKPTKQTKTMAGRKNKKFSCLQSEVPKVCFSVFCGRAQAVNHSSWTNVSTLIWVIKLDRICLGLLSHSIQNS